jgi:hypothetical protein
MSKLSTARSCPRSRALRLRTYAEEPMSPSSSAPHKAKRSPRAGRTPRRRACRATSSTSAEPDPLSLIPGPFATESRCAPSRTAPPLRPGRSAITFTARARRVTTESMMRTSTVPACAERASSEPSADEIPSTGMSMPGRTSVPRIGAVRPGTPSLAMRTAAAPAALAFRAFWNMKHVPRRTRATARRGKPSKCERSQPLEAEAGSTGAIWLLTVPPPE